LKYKSTELLISVDNQKTAGRAVNIVLKMKKLYARNITLQLLTIVNKPCEFNVWIKGEKNLLSEF
jgi:hypothetical protein